MSAFVTITGSSTYRVSGFSQEHDSNTFEGRLSNEISVETKAKASDSGNPIRSLSLAINNTDNFIDLSSENLWGCPVTVEVDGITDDFSGVIRSFSQDGNGVLSVTVTEETLSWFKKEIPDEIVRVSTYSDTSREAVGTPVPTVFGGTSTDPVKVKGILVDRVNFRFLLCAGDIRSIVAVYKDREAITTGFTAYTGTSGQANYPGFAYIEFAADPRDENGAWPEILVDVVGLKLASFTETECRNPARVLYYLLTTAATGACGWGLGIDTAKLGTSFTQAIADCDTNAFRIDGAINSARPASYWINQICLACRGRLLYINGLIEFYIDQNTASAKTFTVDNMALLNWGKWESNARKNRHVIDYRYDVSDGVLLATAFRDDTTSQALIETNEDRQQALLIKDHDTANKIADYLSRVETYGENRIRFEATDYTGVKETSVITITRSDLGLSGALFRVISMSANGFSAIIEARSYSTDVFGNDTPTSTDDPPLDPRSGSTVAAPVATSGISLSAGTRVQADGTLIAYIDGTFTQGERTLYTMVEAGEGASPASWINLGNFVDFFHFEPCKLGQLYTFRFTGKNVTGSATPATGSITSGTDTTAPGTPGAPVPSVLFKSIRVKCSQNATKAPDLAGFKIFRHTSNDSASSSEIGFQPCAGNEDNVVFLDEGTGYGATYYYWTKAVDKSGNVSGFSAAGGPVTTATVVGDDIANSAISTLKIAAGAVDASKTAIAAISPTTGNLVANSVTSGNIVAGTIVGSNIAAGTIAAANIVSGTITSLQIAANTITASNIAAGTITATQIAAGTITGDKICSGTLMTVALCSQSGTIGGWTIGSGAIYSCMDANNILNINSPVTGVNSIIAGTLASGVYSNVSFGQLLRHGYAWDCKFGINFSYNGTNYFEVSRHMTTGALTAQIAGWNFTDYALQNSVSGCYDIALSAQCYCSIYVGYKNAYHGFLTYAMHGRTFWNCTWQNVYGFSVGAVACCGPSFVAGETSLGTQVLSNGETIAQSSPIFWVGDACNYMRWVPGSLKVIGKHSNASSFVSLWNTNCSLNFCTPALEVTTCGSAGATFMAYCAYALMACACGNIGLYGKANGCFGIYGVAGVDCAVVGYASGQFGGSFNSAGYPALQSCNGAWLYNGAWIGVGLTVAGPVCATSFVCTSSRALKYDNTDVSVISGIRSLQVQAYKRFADDSSKWHFGTYAEDMQAAFPWISDGKTIAIDVLMGITLKGLQEVDSEVITLKARIAALEERLAA